MAWLPALPKGWNCDGDTHQEYGARRGWLDRLVQIKARIWYRRVNGWQGWAPGMDLKDAEQVARVAVLRGLETFDEGRGPLDAYLFLLMGRALDETAGRARGEERFSSGGLSIRDPSWFDTLPAPGDGTGGGFGTSGEWQERQRECGQISRLAQTLDDGSRRILNLLRCPPPELAVLSRNLTGYCRGRRPSVKAMAQWTGMSERTVEKAITELRRAFAPLRRGGKHETRCTYQQQGI